MAEIPYACLYRSYEKELELLSPEQLGRLVWALLRYLNHGEEPELPEPERYLWPRLREQHLRDIAHYDDVCQRNRANGTKGGYAKAERTKIRAKAVQSLAGASESGETAPFLASASESNETAPFLASASEGDVSASVLAVGPKEREKEKEKEKEKHTITEDVCVSFPSKEDVSCFCTEQGLQYVDAERFVSYYDSIGWVINGQAIRDWKAAVKLWNHRERCKAENKRGTHGFIDDQLAGKYGTVV